MRIGIISDTHNFLDPRIGEVFSSVEHILHAGDVGSQALLRGLEAIAPVTAVLGNTDSGVDLNLTEAARIGQRKFLVHHIVYPHALTDDLKNRIAREQPDAVVFGHTHKLFSKIIDGVLFLNPGYAGKPKFGAERSVAVLHCTAQQMQAEYFRL